MTSSSRDAQPPEAQSGDTVPADSHHKVHPPDQGQFHRALGTLDSTAIVVGSMIGSGIFLVSADTARAVGSPGLLLVAWLLAGLLTIAGALCYSELAAMYPKAGGQYVFLREGWGRLAAFLYGWTLFMVIQSGTIAAVGVGFAKFLGVFVPWVSADRKLWELGHLTLPTGPLDISLSSAQLVGVAVIAFLTAVNCRGIETSKVIQTTFTLTKVAALFGLIVLGLVLTDRWHGLPVNFTGNFFAGFNSDGTPILGMALLSVMTVAMVGPLFSCDAWNNVTFAGEEVKDAHKTLPKALFLGTLLVVGIYLLANLVYLLLLPLHGVKDGADLFTRGIQYAAENRVGTAAAQVIFGDVGAYIMAGAIMISTFGCLNGLIMAGARVYYAMAQDGLFFRSAGVLDTKFGVPIFGLIIQGAWSCLLATSGTYGQLLDYVVFAALLFYVLTAAAVIKLRRTAPDQERPYKTPFYPWLPALYVVAATVVMVGQICQPGSFAARGLIIIATGLPAFLLWNYKKAAA